MGWNGIAELGEVLLEAKTASAEQSRWKLRRVAEASPLGGSHTSDSALTFAPTLQLLEGVLCTLLDPRIFAVAGVFDGSLG